MYDAWKNHYREHECVNLLSDFFQWPRIFIGLAEVEYEIQKCLRFVFTFKKSFVDLATIV